MDFLADAHNLVAKNSTAGFLFSVIAIESGLKSTLLKPLVCGLVHTSSIAELIADLTLSHTGVDRFRDLLFWLLNEHGKIDLKDYKRSKSRKGLWQEIKEVQKLRNRVMHRAESVSRDQADFSICVGSAILETIFPSIVAEMDLHLHDGYRICNDWRCRNREIAERLAK